MKRLVLAFLVCAAADGGTATDSADEGFAVRALHVVMAPPNLRYKAISYDFAVRITDLAAQEGFNTIVLQIANSVQFSHGELPTRPGSWTTTQLSDYVEYAGRQGLHVVPELKLLTHQEKFLQNNRPELLFNAVTYDPGNKEVYDIVLPVLDEIIDVMNPPAVHIGHDEVVGWNEQHARKKLNPGERMLPAELFARDVEILHAHLKKRGVETWMWGDMLISLAEFPGMAERHLHGAIGEYGSKLREKIPQDIVIVDWHYFDKQPQFPSLAKMQDEGRRVIGATWHEDESIRNFSHYARQKDAHGMMATLWYYVPRQDWKTITDIVGRSSAAFQSQADSPASN